MGIKENIDEKFNDTLNKGIKILTKSLDSDNEQVRVNAATSLIILK